MSSIWFMKYENPIPVSVAVILEEILDLEGVGSDRMSVCRTRSIDELLYVCHNMGYPCWGYEWDHYWQGEPQAPGDIKKWTFSGDAEHYECPITSKLLGYHSDAQLGVALLKRFFSNVAEAEVTVETSPSVYTSDDFHGTGFCAHSCLDPETPEADEVDDKYAGWVASGYTQSQAASKLRCSHYDRSSAFPEHRLPPSWTDNMKMVYIDDDDQLLFPDEAEEDGNYRRLWWTPYPEWMVRHRLDIHPLCKQLDDNTNYRGIKVGKLCEEFRNRACRAEGELDISEIAAECFGELTPCVTVTVEGDSRIYTVTVKEDSSDASTQC